MKSRQNLGRKYCRAHFRELLISHLAIASTR